MAEGDDEQSVLSQSSQAKILSTHVIQHQKIKNSSLEYGDILTYIVTRLKVTTGNTLPVFILIHFFNNITCEGHLAYLKQIHTFNKEA